MNLEFRGIDFYRNINVWVICIKCSLNPELQEKFT